MTRTLFKNYNEFITEGGLFDMVFNIKGFTSFMQDKF